MNKGYWNNNDRNSDYQKKSQYKSRNNNNGYNDNNVYSNRNMGDGMDATINQERSSNINLYNSNLILPNKDREEVKENPIQQKQKIFKEITQKETDVSQANSVTQENAQSFLIHKKSTFSLKVVLGKVTFYLSNLTLRQLSENFKTLIVPIPEDYEDRKDDYEFIKEFIEFGTNTLPLAITNMFKSNQSSQYRLPTPNYFSSTNYFDHIILSVTPLYDMGLQKEVEELNNQVEQITKIILQKGVKKICWPILYNEQFQLDRQLLIQKPLEKLQKSLNQENDQFDIILYSQDNENYQYLAMILTEMALQKK